MGKTPVRNGFYRAIIGFYLAVFGMAMLGICHLVNLYAIKMTINFIGG
jgi:hypothetical protein